MPQKIQHVDPCLEGSETLKGFYVGGDVTEVSSIGGQGIERM